MKKFVVITIFLISLFLIPLNAEARTIAQYRQDLQNMKNRKAEIESNSAQIQKEIDQANAKIKSIQEQAEAAMKEKEAKEKEIDELNEKIKVKREQIKSLISFYQISNGENFYLEYLFGAKSFTDFIYRFSIIEQLSGANNELIDEMNDLIVQNKEKITELEKKQEELKSLNSQLLTELAKLGDRKLSLSKDGIDMDTQIAQLQKNIDRYVAEGCSENQDVSTCSSVPEDTGFIKPISHGQITDNFGWRGYTCSGCSSFHKGIDIGVSEGTPVYAAAAGKVADIMRRYYCGGNIISLNHTVNGRSYTTVYKHLLTINVNVGEYVEKGQQIGTSGGGPQTWSYETCSTGSHLHFEMANGRYTATGDYYTYIQHLFDPREMLNFPPYGGWF